jgi:hypothetical protein
LRDALDSFVAYGGNLFWQNSNERTILSLIMRHGVTFECLHHYVFRQSEPWAINELFSLDKWLVGILQHTNTKFRKALRRYFESYRSVFASSIAASKLETILNIDVIVSEIGSACTKDRVEFLKIISKWGTGDMIVPFLRAGIDLDEKYSNEQMP